MIKILTRDEIIRIIKNDDEKVVAVFLELEEKRLEAYNKGYKDELDGNLEGFKALTLEEILAENPNISPAALKMRFIVQAQRAKAYEIGQLTALRDNIKGDIAVSL